MPSFQSFFMKTQGQPIEFEGKTLYLADKFPIKNGEKIIISIESTNSEYAQGLSIGIEGYCEMYGQVNKNKGKIIKMIFWEDSVVLDIKNIEMKIFTQRGFVWIKNIWERYSLTGAPYKESGQGGAAMIVEEIENGRRYRCNDGHPDENFDDIIFTVRRIP